MPCTCTVYTSPAWIVHTLFTILMVMLLTNIGTTTGGIAATAASAQQNLLQQCK